MFTAGSREIPPPLGLECLKVLWTLGEGSVRSVRDALAVDRKLAYTTVMTVLDRLTRKGTLERRKVGRCFIYVPLVSRERLRQLAVKHVVDSFFDGSEGELIEYLTSERPELRPIPVQKPARPGLEEDLLDPALL